MTQNNPNGSANDTSDQGPDYMLTILIVGNSTAGKTSFLNRYIYDSFTSAYIRTCDVDFATKCVFCHDKCIKLQIWDTAGNECYRQRITQFIRRGMGFILMYDITDEESFNAVQEWVLQIKTHSFGKPPVILIGNKCDMENERIVLSEKGRKLAEELDFEFFETSIKENINVEAALERLVDMILEKMFPISKDPSGTQAGAYNTETIRLSDNDQQPKGNQCQC